MNHQGLLWNVPWIATVSSAKKQLNFKTAIIRSKRLWGMVMKPSKLQRRKQRFTVEGPQLYTIHGFCSYTMHELHNHIFCTVKTKKATKNVEQRFLSGFIPIPQVLTMVKCSNYCIYAIVMIKNNCHPVFGIKSFASMALK